jgi:hypothetical protein
MKKWVFYVVIFLSLTASGFGLSLLDWNPQHDEAGVIAAYETLQHPAGSRQLSYQIGRKNQEHWINSLYRYEQAPGDIAAWYRTSLTGQGWTAVQYDVGYGQPFYAYIKGDFLLVLGLHRNDDWTITLHYRDKQKVYEPI